MTKTCSIEGCYGTKSMRRGLCLKHYTRKRRGQELVTSKELFAIGIPKNCIAVSNDKYAIVDKDIFDDLNKFVWGLSKDGYAVRSSKILGNYKVIYMHREVIKLKDSEICDHMNRNPLDNRRKNLRKCTYSQNMMNTKLRSDNSSGFRGVSYSKNMKSWIAYVEAKKRMRVIGYFKDKVEAAKARDCLAKKLHGEFAFLNFPTLV